MYELQTAWYFIVNPRAGSGKTMSEWVPAEKKLDKMGIPYVTSYTDHKRHATTLAYEAAEEGYRKILAVGGDGSLHEVFTGIMQWCDEHSVDPSVFRLAVAPIGSGNDWIKSTGVPHDVEAVMDLLAKESYGEMDVVRVKAGDRTCYMANIGGGGFDSHVCERVNRQKESGMRNKMIYLNSLRYTIFHLKPINLMVVADGKEFFKGACYSFALGNGRYSGSGMRQVPLASIDDGILDFTIIPKLPLTTIFKQIPRLFNGTLNESHDVLCGKCRKLEIIPLDARSADIFELDGEIDGKLPISVEMSDDRIGILKA